MGASAAPPLSARGNADRFVQIVRHDFAQSTKTVFLAMAGVMAVCFVVAVARLERGVPEEVSRLENA
jgi:hypothetical protein